jgi:RNA-directed DNA polymerase
MLANLVCLKLDAMLQQCASDYGCTVSRYADDIVFSARELGRGPASAIVKRTAAILGEFGFVRRHGKTHVATPGSRRVVTGLLVDRGKPKLQKDYREKLCLHLYHARTKTIPEHCRRRNFKSLVGFKNHLDGLITYAEKIEPIFGAKCRSEFQALPWGDLTRL